MISVQTFFPRARAKGSRLVGLPLGVWIERRTMPERAGPIEKSKEILRFFNIFRLEASKTNCFSTFWLRKLQKPEEFQWFWGRAGPGQCPGPAWNLAGPDGARPAADGAGPAGPPGQAGPDRAPRPGPPAPNHRLAATATPGLRN